jgi:hypothetical protein
MSWRETSGIDVPVAALTPAQNSKKSGVIISRCISNPGLRCGMKHFLRVQESVGLGIMLLFDTITRIREAHGGQSLANSYSCSKWRLKKTIVV